MALKVLDLFAAVGIKPDSDSLRELEAFITDIQQRVAKAANIAPDLIVGGAVQQRERKAKAASAVKEAEKLAKDKARVEAQAAKEAARAAAQAEREQTAASKRAAAEAKRMADRAARERVQAEKAAAREVARVAKEAERTQAKAQKEASDAAKKKADDAQKASQEFASTAAGTFAGLLAILGPMALAGGLRTLAESLATSTLEMDKQATAARVDVVQLSGMSYAARQAGVEVSDLSGAMKSLNDQGKAARKGDEDAQKAIRRLGYTIKDFDRLSPDQKIRAVADGLAKIGSANKRQKVADQLLGEDGANKLKDFLALGSSGINKLQTEAQELGLIIRPEQVKAAKEFDAALAGVKARAGAAWGTFTQQLLPALTELLGTLQAILGKELKAGTPTLKDAGRTVAQLVREFNAWLKANEPLLRQLADLSRDAKLGNTALQTLFATVAALAGAKGILALVEGIAKGKTALQALSAAAAAPAVKLALITAALLLLFAILQDYARWKSGKGGSALERLFGKATEQQLADVKTMLFAVLIAVGLVALAFGALPVAIGATIAAIVSMKDEIADFFSNLIGWLSIELKAEWDASLERAADWINDLRDMMDALVDGLRARWEAFFAWLREDLGRVADVAKIAADLSTGNVAGAGSRLAAQIIGGGAANAGVDAQARLARSLTTGDINVTVTTQATDAEGTAQAVGAELENGVWNRLFQSLTGDDV